MSRNARSARIAGGHSTVVSSNKSKSATTAKPAKNAPTQERSANSLFNALRRVLGAVRRRMRPQAVDGLIADRTRRANVALKAAGPRQAKPTPTPTKKTGSTPTKKTGSKPGGRTRAPLSAPATVKTSGDRAAAATPRTSTPNAGAVARRGKEAPKTRVSAPARPSALKSVVVSVEGVRIHAVDRASRRRAARASETAVILIHGAGVDHRDWTFDFINRIDRRWRVVAFDRPGFGASERPNGAASALPATQARILRGAAAALGVRQAVVVGHSWGGAVAMAWGVDAPDTTLGVASFAGAVAPWSLANAIKNGRRIQAAARTAFGSGGLQAAAVDALSESFSPGHVPKGYFDHMATELSPLSGPTAATMADVSTINGALSLLTPKYARFERPVELIYGKEDLILSVQEQGEAAAALLPMARLTVLPGVGHMVHHSSPLSCVNALNRLLAAAA